MAIWSILRPFGIFCSHQVYFMGYLVNFSRFGILYQKNLATLVYEQFHLLKTFAKMPIPFFPMMPK
jgi:hypothetical protein